MAKKSGLTTTSETAAPAELCALVEKFAEHRETYRRPGYNETQLRQDLLDPFFIALGWDIYNQGGIHENWVTVRRKINSVPQRGSTIRPSAGKM